MARPTAAMTTVGNDSDKRDDNEEEWETVLVFPKNVGVLPQWWLDAVPHKTRDLIPIPTMKRPKTRTTMANVRTTQLQQQQKDASKDSNETKVVETELQEKKEDDIVAKDGTRAMEGNTLAPVHVPTKTETPITNGIQGDSTVDRSSNSSRNQDRVNSMTEPDPTTAPVVDHPDSSVSAEATELRAESRDTVIVGTSGSTPGSERNTVSGVALTMNTKTSDGAVGNGISAMSPEGLVGNIPIVDEKLDASSGKATSAATTINDDENNNNDHVKDLESVAVSTNGIEKGASGVSLTENQVDTVDNTDSDRLNDTTPTIHGSKETTTVDSGEAAKTNQYHGTATNPQGLTGTGTAAVTQSDDNGEEHEIATNELGTISSNVENNESSYQKADDTGSSTTATVSSPSTNKMKLRISSEEEAKLVMQQQYTPQREKFGQEYLRKRTGSDKTRSSGGDGTSDNDSVEGMLPILEHSSSTNEEGNDAGTGQPSESHDSVDADLKSPGSIRKQKLTKRQFKTSFTGVSPFDFAMQQKVKEKQRREQERLAREALAQHHAQLSEVDKASERKAKEQEEKRKKVEAEKILKQFKNKGDSKLDKATSLRKLNNELQRKRKEAEDLQRDHKYQPTSGLQESTATPAAPASTEPSTHLESTSASATTTSTTDE